MLADIYKADPSRTYQIGGWTGDEWTYEYSNKLYDIFPVDTTEIDLSICIAGNIDCDHFNSITMDYFQYRMLVKDSESSNPNYRKMVVDEKFTGYKTGKLLGSCLIATNNSGYTTWSITDRVMRVGSGDLSDARFCLGNKVKGFKNLILAPSGLSVEKIPPVTSSNSQYSGNSFETINTLENVENRVLKTFGYNIKHFERKTSIVELTVFANAYKPQLAFLVQCEDGELLLVSATGMFNRVNGGLISNFQNGIPISYTFGKMIENPEWEQMCTDVTKPQWTSRPPLGNVTENLNSMYCEVYTSRSTWYIYSSKLFVGALARRILTLSGLFFSWDVNGIDTGVNPDTFNSKLCLGQRDEYGNILQDGYNKGWEEIQEKDEYFDKLDYNNLPTVNPNPPLPDADEIDDMKLEPGHSYGGMINYYKLTPANLVVFAESITSSDLPAGFDALKNIVSLKKFHSHITRYAEFDEAENIHVGYYPTGCMAEPLSFTKGHITIGSYTIQGYHGSANDKHFLDLDPYTTIEVYIPFCGFVSIPATKCMYNTIDVILAFDVIIGNCVGIVKCNGNIVAQKSGMIAEDVPLVAENVGMMNSAIAQSSLTTLFGLGSMSAGLATTSPISAVSGGVAVASGISQLIMSLHKNWTEVVGSTSGEIPFLLPDHCYVKITYPRKVVPETYGKHIGYMCGKDGLLGNFKGFTICENAHVEVDCTDTEKEILTGLLSQGIIMPYDE